MPIFFPLNQFRVQLFSEKVISRFFSVKTISKKSFLPYFQEFFREIKFKESCKTRFHDFFCCPWKATSNTGWPQSKFGNSKCYILWKYTFLNICLQSQNVFRKHAFIFENYKQTAETWKWMQAFKTHFGFTNIFILPHYCLYSAFFCNFSWNQKCS